MLGGGTFVTQNKVLPGSYINFVTLDNGVNVFGERGTGALGLELDYGSPNIQVVTREDFQKKSMEIFGYEYTNDKLKAVREFFKHGKTLLFANLNGGNIASNAYARAKYPGMRGNDIKIVVQTNVDNAGAKDVLTYMGTTLVDSQTVNSADKLIDNAYVNFIKSATLTETAGTNLTGGKTDSITGLKIQKFLSNLEAYTFNTVGLVIDFEKDDDSYGDFELLLIEWTKRMRDEVGKKFQCITSSESDDYEGNIYVMNPLKVDSNSIITAWIVGAVAGCEINKSLTNMKYDGECDIMAEYSQSELEGYIKGGYFTFHKVNDEVRVLMDINTLTSFTDEKGKDFSDNQTIRVCDQIAMDIATIFNNYYLGKIPNDEAGRSSLWAEIVKHHNKLTDLRAIENFNSEDIIVVQGETKKSVVVTDCITPVNAMTQLYMTVIVQ